MPNLYTHISFGRDVLKRLPREVRTTIEAERGAYELGCIGPDFLFILRETGVGGVPYYAVKMHYAQVYEVFDSLQKYFSEHSEPVKFAYAMGLMCHYVLDSTLHPYVFETTTRYAEAMFPAGAAGKAHHFIESAIDEYYITDRGITDAYKIVANGKVKGEIGELYEQVINPLFGEGLRKKHVKFAFGLAKVAIKLSRDRTGINRKGIRFAEKLFFKGDMKFSPLVRPPIGNGEIDYFNIEHREFGITRGGEETEAVSVYDLLERALVKADEYLPAFYNATKGGAPLAKDKFKVNYEGQELTIDKDEFIKLAREKLAKSKK